MGVSTVNFVWLLAVLAASVKPHERMVSREGVGYSILNHTVQAVSQGCSVTNVSQVASAMASCTTINVGSFSVPASYQPMVFQLKSGTSLTFTGQITFEKHAVKGYLMEILGDSVTVMGSSTHLFHGHGELYWDGSGGSGTPKPTFLYLRGSGGSLFSGLSLRNCPMRCVAIDASNNLTVSGFLIDNRDGAPSTAASGKEGHNTDGFDISKTTYLTLNHHVVYNQDDCVALNSAANVMVDDVYCFESHGFDIAAGMSTDDPTQNVVENITFQNSVLYDSMYGLHILTCNDGGGGYVNNISYYNIVLNGSTHYGIMIQQDFSNAKQRSFGSPTGNVPISNIFFSYIGGFMYGEHAKSLSIRCAKDACSNIVFEEVGIIGAPAPNECLNFKISKWC